MRFILVSAVASALACGTYGLATAEDTSRFGPELQQEMGSLGEMKAEQEQMRDHSNSMLDQPTDMKGKKKQKKSEKAKRGALKAEKKMKVGKAKGQSKRPRRKLRIL